MKKLLVFLFVAFISITSVSAMSEDELKTKLTDTYKVNGATYKASDSQKTAIKQYLNQYEVSSSDADYIVSKLNEALDILKNSGKTRFYDMTKSDKNKIIALVSDVATNTSVKVAIVKGNLVVYKPGTSDIFYETPINPVNGDIVQTSRGLTVAIAGVISAIGIAIALRKVKVNA
ncbi:MAG: hypothetical protein IJ105_01695 [Bacilli bacterium]|nr:hypothetical protein [Bacilli bacterium]